MATSKKQILPVQNSRFLSKFNHHRSQKLWFGTNTSFLVHCVDCFSQATLSTIICFYCFSWPEMRNKGELINWWQIRHKFDGATSIYQQIERERSQQNPLRNYSGLTWIVLFGFTNQLSTCHEVKSSLLLN